MIIFLTGFMGSGKSFIGNKLAGKISFEFIDLDQYIEKMEACTIPEIFEKQGEKKFREIEHRHLRSLTIKENLVVATGGGTPCYSENMAWMNSNGITIYLQTSVVLLKERLCHTQEHRPLLKDFTNNALGRFIKLKLNERKFYYEQAIWKIYQRKGSSLTMDKVLAFLEKSYGIKTK